MNASVSLTVIGILLVVIGIIFTAIPQVVNKYVFGELTGEAEQIAASGRLIVGGCAITIGLVAFFCRNFPTSEARMVLLALGTGSIILFITVLSSKFRGYDKYISVPPLVAFLIIALLAFTSI